MFSRAILIIFVFTIISSCSTSKEEEITTVVIKDPEVVINCSNSAVIITEDDAIAIPSDTNPVSWVGSYTSTTVQVSFTKEIGFDDVTERHTFVFNKVNGCLKIDHAYKYYDGKLVDVSAISEMELHGFFTQDWEIDEKFSGVVTYKDPHDGQFYTRKFWVELTATDFFEEPTEFQLFSDCYLDKLPVEIDMDKNGTIDFNLSYLEIRNFGSIPAYSQYTMQLISTDNDINFILSPKRNSSPYNVLFESPFTTQNTRQYFNGVKNALDVFYEFDAPYQKYNYFLSNNLTYKTKLNNNADNYFAVSMSLDESEYFGWIKFRFSSITCSVEVLDTFLNTTPDEHISVD
jgi:hypothetical protein